MTSHPAARAASPIATADGTPAGDAPSTFASLPTPGAGAHAAASGTPARRYPLRGWSASHLPVPGRALVRGPGHVPVERVRYLGPRTSRQRLVEHWGEWWWVPLIGCDDGTELPF